MERGTDGSVAVADYLHCTQAAEEFSTAGSIGKGGVRFQGGEAALREGRGEVR